MSTNILHLISGYLVAFSDDEKTNLSAFLNAIPGYANTSDTDNNSDTVWKAARQNALDAVFAPIRLNPFALPHWGLLELAECSGLQLDDTSRKLTVEPLACLKAPLQPAQSEPVFEQPNFLDDDTYTTHDDTADTAANFHNQTQSLKNPAPVHAARDIIDLTGDETIDLTGDDAIDHAIPTTIQSTAPLATTAQQNTTTNNVVAGRWDPAENGACIEYMKLVSQDPRYAFKERRFQQVADLMKRHHGYDRSNNAVKIQWNRYLRELAGFDERDPNKIRNNNMTTGALKKRASPPSAAAVPSLPVSSAQAAVSAPPVFTSSFNPAGIAGAPVQGDQGVRGVKRRRSDDDEGKEEEVEEEDGDEEGEGEEVKEREERGEVKEREKEVEEDEEEEPVQRRRKRARKASVAAGDTTATPPPAAAIAAAHQEEASEVKETDEEMARRLTLELNSTSRLTRRQG